MLRLPWHSQHIYSRVLTLDQTKIVFESRSRVWFWQKSRRKEREKLIAEGKQDLYFDEMDRETAVEQANSTQVPYRYVLKRGEVQDRVATVHMDERAWGWLWLPLPFHRRRSVDFRFNEEVGEQTGSWKGGVLGSGVTLLPSEWNRPDGYLLAFRRMEADRNF